MSGAADGGRDGGDLPERRGEARRESGLGVSGADDGALPASDATDKALHVQSLDIPAVAAQLSLSPRGLLSRLLRGGEGEAGGNVVTVDVPVVRDEDPSRVADHDARSGLSTSLLSRRARRAEATDAENAAASHALFAATATAPPPRLSRGGAATRHLDDEHLESLAPLLQRTAGTSRRAPSGRPDNTTPVSSPRAAADSPLGYIVGVPVGSTLVPDTNPDGRDVEDVEARLARAVAYATDGEVGESEAAAAAARISRDDGSTGLAAADDDVLVRRVIFAVPSRASFGGSGGVGEGPASAGTDSGAETRDAYASFSNAGSERRLKFGGASTRFSLPTAVTNVTLEMRNPLCRDDATSSTRGRRRLESETETETETETKEEAFLVDARDGDETLDVARYVTRDDASDASASASSSFGDSSIRGDVADFSSTTSRGGGVSWRRLRASVVVERRVPVIGWLVLAAAVVSLSAMGTMVTLERSKPFTQSSWRAQSVLLVALPWAIAAAKKQGLRGFRVARVRRRAFLVAACWSGWFLTLFYGLATTSIAHAYVLTNTTGAFIVVHKVLTRNAVPRSHFVGVALATAGAGVVMWQSSVGEKNNDDSASSGRGSATVAGDAVVAAGAISGAAFLVLAKGVREEMELSLLVVLQMLVNLPISLTLAVALERCSFASPFDPRRGVIGWLTKAQIGKQLFISVCGTIVGTCGYIASLKYLAPTVVAIAMLLEPILAALIGWAAGVNAFPDWKTCFGMAAVAAGTAVIAAHAGRARVRTVDVDAHRHRNSSGGVDRDVL